MKSLLEMHREEMARRAQIAFNKAMKAAQAEMPRVVKNAENEQTRTGYATYDAISDAMQPVIDRHGFALTFGEADSPKPGQMRITCDVLHEEGHLKPYHADVPIDRAGPKGNVNKSDALAFLSTTSYGRRALKMMIFDVATKGAKVVPDENDFHNDSLISPEQADDIRRLMKERGVTLNRLLAWVGVEALPDIRAADFQRVTNALQRVERGKGGRR